MKYKLVRAKRKTLVIDVTDGAVTVKAPLDKPIGYIEKFVEEKSGWIQKKLDAYAKKTAYLKDVISGDAALYRGVSCPVAVTDAVKKVKLGDNVLYLPVKYALQPARDRAVAAWYKRVALGELAERLYAISAATGLKYKSFALTNARTKWGSCDAQCNIRLNWRLVMLDAALVDYVIVHELSHTVHHDHSAAFWAQVGKFYPDYKAARKRLKTFSVVTSMYR